MKSSKDLKNISILDTMVQKLVVNWMIAQPDDQIDIIKSVEPSARIDWFKILETKSAVSRSMEWMKVESN